ncbi:hypothetical protein [Micromonospora marina]|uniref:hypothetical protein n=1 Tax=Micromonospora marina TaxID=307120 RepID=UPI003456A66B
MQKCVERLDIGGTLSGLEPPFRSTEIHPPILSSAPRLDKRVSSRQNTSTDGIAGSASAVRLIGRRYARRPAGIYHP